VLLEIPIDVMHMPVEEAEVLPPGGLHVRTAPAPAPEQVNAIIDMLKSAQRPGIFVGSGVPFSCAQAELRRFAEASGIPVFVNSHAQGALPYDHPLYAKDLGLLGMLPMMGQPGIDALLMVGARLGLFTGGRNPVPVPHDIPIAQVDLHGPELGRLREAAIPVLADARETFRALADAAAKTNWPDWSAWSATAAGLKHMIAMMFGEPDLDVSPVHPFHAVRMVVEGAPADSIFVIDGGEASAWAHTAVCANAPHQVLGAGYLGCLGTGPGMAIGAALSHPGTTVVQLAGDGALGFHLQEFETMARNELPIITVVLNNALWGMSAHGQDLIYGAGKRVISTLPDTAYEEVAKALGCYGERVTRLAELAPALRRALAAGRPACLNVSINPDIVHPTMPTMVGADTQGENEIMIPYYDNIRL